MHCCGSLTCPVFTKGASFDHLEGVDSSNPCFTPAETPAQGSSPLPQLTPSRCQGQSEELLRDTMVPEAPPPTGRLG